MFASIIIRTYNSEQYVERAIKSALAQEFPRNEFEIVVIDDGSTDKTLEILGKFGEKIRCVGGIHKGAVPTANEGFRIALGEYVSFLDADDECSPKFLQKMTAAIKQDNADFVYCDYWEISVDGNKKLVSCRDNLFNTLFGNILFRKKSITEEGLLNESLVFPEYDLLLKTLEGWTGVYIQEPLFSYYRHDGSITASQAKVTKGMDQLRILHPDKLDTISKIRQY